MTVLKTAREECCVLGWYGLQNRFRQALLLVGKPPPTTRRPPGWCSKSLGTTALLPFGPSRRKGIAQQRGRELPNMPCNAKCC